MLQNANDWAQTEFGEVELGDQRLTERTVKLAAGLATECEGTLPSALSGAAEIKAGYRLFDNAKVTFEKLQAAHWAHTRQACAGRGTYLLIEDTTDLNFTRGEEIEGLGWNGNPQERGFLCHTTLAVHVERWKTDGEPEVNVLGLFGQTLWTRLHPPRKKKERKQARLKRQRESDRWGHVLTEVEPPGPGTERILVADREADIFELFERCQKADTSFILRAARPRTLFSEEGHLLDAARRAPCLGTTELDLRARPGQAARTVRLEVRARTVTLRGPRRPGGRPAPYTLQVVCVREAHPPAGAEPLEWILLTNLPCQTLTQCVKWMRLYAQRWLIEEYHKALKTGLGAEHSQLETAARLSALLAVLCVVAARLLKLKTLGRAQPERLVEEDELTPAMKAVLHQRFDEPQGGWTYRATLRAIAVLGGFMGRKGDGEPGWLTIWRGWNRLARMAEGYEMKRCG